MRLLQLAGPISVLSLAGCAGTIGVQPAGPGIWAVSEMRAPVLGGGPAAQDAALREANGFCAQQGLVFVPVQMGPGGNPYGHYGPVSFTATFRCLAANDPTVLRMRAGTS
jgi:hypothetical protein